MNIIVTLLFKAYRRLALTCNTFSDRLKLTYYNYISEKRFKFYQQIIIGRRFSIKYDLSNTSITIDKGFRARDNFNITIGRSGRLTIGSNCFFNNNCSVNCLGQIEIGGNNQFGEVVLFYDHNHVYTDKHNLIADQGYNIGSIKIGNNCWIGSNVVILKNVEIGDNVVIGAGCIIHKSIPSNSVVTNHQNLVIK